MTRPPVVIELDETTDETPATAPPVPDPAQQARDGWAMRTLVGLGRGEPLRVMRFVWASLVGLLGFIVSLAAWDYVTGLLARNTVLGSIALGLVALVLAGLVILGLRELAAFARLRRIDGLQRDAAQARAQADLALARRVLERLDRLYAPRADLRWPCARLRERAPEALDADALLALAEAELMPALDAAAAAEVEAAARQVATVTALVPLVLADLIAALGANMRMIRRIAQIYGGRSGVFGNWRLLRQVMTHLVATGAVAVGDDMLEPLIGGGLLGKLSRRFGEGVVNGALTARVGVAAIEVCRPLPFHTGERPLARRLVKRALAGLFGGGA